MTNTLDALDVAQRRLETATVTFSNMETLFDQRKVTVEQFRQSWDELDRARRAVDRICRERFEEARA